MIFLGFEEFEVIEELWGEDNPCQIYVMSLTKQVLIMKKWYDEEQEFCIEVMVKVLHNTTKPMVAELS